MSAPYELLLFPASTGGVDHAIDSPPGGEGRGRLDRYDIGEFLLRFGPGLRFAAHTALGDQYVYEDERGCGIEIMIAEEQVALGFPHEPNLITGRARRVAMAIALALVARFDLVLFDPQRGRYIRAHRA